MRALLKRFICDQGGAALVEYTVLLAILLVAVLSSIVLVASWISGQWATFFGLLP